QSFDISDFSARKSTKFQVINITFSQVFCLIPPYLYQKPNCFSDKMLFLQSCFHLPIVIPK
ncbi:MAG: hypothetical protein LBN18_05980, partial [Dysgonamonadaceae bacterium]|nr:hypothetical protein [Dysgonamonadaceae bacterium]